LLFLPINAARNALSGRRAKPGRQLPQKEAKEETTEEEEEEEEPPPRVLMGVPDADASARARFLFSNLVRVLLLLREAM